MWSAIGKTPQEVVATQVRIDAGKPAVDAARLQEANAVSAAQTSKPFADSSPNPDGHWIVAAHWSKAFQTANEAQKAAKAACGSDGDCMAALDGPWNPSSDPKIAKLDGKNAAGRMFYYKLWTETEVALGQQKANAQKPIPPPSTLPTGTGRPNFPVNIFVADPGTVGDVDGSETNSTTTLAPVGLVGLVALVGLWILKR